MKLVGLSSEEHKSLKIQTRNKFEYAENYHSISLASAEMLKAALSFPILFIQNKTDDGKTDFDIVAILSLVANQNQYIEDSEWTASYMPSAMRVYPFRLQGESVLIDEDAPHLSESEGDPLFTEEGEPAEALNHAIAFLKTCHDANVETKAWCKRMDELGLITEHNTTIVSPKGGRFKLENFYAIDKEKLDALPDETLSTLAKDGSLALIHAHQISFEHFLKLGAQRDKLTAEAAKVSEVGGS